MSTDAVTSPDAAAPDRMRELIREGALSEAIALADAVIARAEEPAIVGRSLLMKLGCLMMDGHRLEAVSVADQAFDVVLASGDPALMGELYALAAYVALTEGSVDRCVRHLVRGSRTMELVTRADLIAADAWADLAITYSIAGFHNQAMLASVRARNTAAAAGLPPEEYLTPEIPLRCAVSLDHRGDEQGARDMLRAAVALARQCTPGGELRPADYPFYRYASARLRALGEPVELALTEVSLEGHEAADLGALAQVCDAISAGRPLDALAQLDSMTLVANTLGPAELFRLRALAYAAAGDHRAAHTADRQAFRLAGEHPSRLVDRFIEGVGARLDHEDLRRAVGRYAAEALTDPLTGLPNRRHLEQRLAMIAEQRGTAAIGVIDLDGFKTVNTVHGHLSGDLVLERVAAILSRTVRRGDFVARYGGDEFVALLPETSVVEAVEIGGRLAAAVDEEDWEALVAGTPISVTIGWADLAHPADLPTALAEADRAMLELKGARR
ncbi:MULTISPECIES: diguanylate cyclase [unclassified Crossiella]|uniref:GGDEF domain-containing protein n=1 Tax=unclassified Crossiella TaxID=2620835 RepID=UPI0020001109|nr:MULTISPECIES: GGDEF domain-containing protein [unclassified Crossiella]MCK2243198.1 GGDEF domain-containing protein [Crossiella sp. S99.2]MCK2254333.1 GGDEF domain-containing protein [Crossiella sp. S99.1]